jgi:hypothetical protein
MVEATADSIDFFFQINGYDVNKEVLQHYYADGESADFMRKQLQPFEELHPARFGRPKVWQAKGGPFDLPRIMW